MLAFVAIVSQISSYTILRDISIGISLLIIAVLALDTIFIGVLISINKITHKFTENYEFSDLFYKHINDKTIKIFGGIMVTLILTITIVMYVLELKVLSAMFLIMLILSSIFIFNR